MLVHNVVRCITHRQMRADSSGFASFSSAQNVGDPKLEAPGAESAHTRPFTTTAF